MKHKNNITDENYEEVVLRRAINICWILLAICFVMKIFGGNFFDIVCNNEKFVEFCSYVDNHLWCKIIIGSISSYISYSLFYLALARKVWFTRKETIFIIISVPIFVCLRIPLESNAIITFIINAIQYFGLPFFVKRKDKCIEWFIPRFIYGNILNFVFQLISIITKSIGIKLVTDSFLIGIIWMIDVYIMLALYYLYSNKKKGEKNMGWFASWLFGKTEGQLRNMKANRLAKIEKLQEEVKAIDEEMNKKNESKN